MKKISAFFAAALMAGASPLAAHPPEAKEIALVTPPSPCCDLKWGASHFDILSRYPNAHAFLYVIGITSDFLKSKKIDGRLWGGVSFYLNETGELNKIELRASDSYDAYKEKLRKKYGDPIKEVDGTGGPSYDVLEYDYTTWYQESTDSLITIQRSYESYEDVGFILEYKRFSECERCQRLLEETL